MNQKLTSVAIAGIQFAGSATAGMNLVRSLLESNVTGSELVALTSYPLCCALGMWPDVKEIYLIPFPARGPKAMLKRVKEVISQRALQVLIPCYDEEVLTFSRIQTSLARMGVATLLPPYETALSVTKEKLYDTARRSSLPVAETRVYMSMKSMMQDKELRYPVVLKGAVCDAYCAVSPSEARVYYRKIRDIWGRPVLAQRFMEGDEYAVVALGDRSSRMVGSVAIRKIGITEKGKTWCGCTIDDPVLLSLAAETMQKLRWVGPLEIEAIRDRNNGRYTIIEINPRFPTWIYLATAAGQNLPEVLVRLALGESVDSLPPYRSGVVFTRVCGYRTFPIDAVGQLTTDGVAHLDGVGGASTKCSREARIHRSSGDRSSLGNRPY